MDQDMQISDFRYNYDAIIRPSQTRLYKTTPLPKLTSHFTSVNGFESEIRSQTVISDTIEIIMPRENFQKFMDDQASTIQMKRRWEENLRSQYKSLQNAWEQYQIILALVKN